MKRLFLVLILLACVGVPLALGTAVALMLQDEPRVRRPVEFTPVDVERAKRQLRLHDPRRQPAGARQGDTPRTVELSGADLDLLVDYLASRFGRGGSRIALRRAAATLEASIELPANPLGRFLNVTAVLQESAGLPELRALTLGSLPLPGWLAGPAVRTAVQAFGGGEGVRLMADSVRAVGIMDTGVRITYEWRGDFPDRLRKLAVPAVERERLAIYQQHLARLTANADMPRSVSLGRLLAPMMSLASERSAGGDARAENRALIAVLAFHANGSDWAKIIPEAKSWPRSVARQVTLRGRHDLAQHFIVSAALAAFAGTPLADAIGLDKELADARGGSGFSFDDLAADRAGTLFGERAAGGEARDLQRRVAAGVSESDLMPDVAGLPGAMPEAEFRRRFGGIGTPAYDAMMREIERRLAGCALYRGRATAEAR